MSAGRRDVRYGFSHLRLDVGNSLLIRHWRLLTATGMKGKEQKAFVRRLQLYIIFAMLMCFIPEVNFDREGSYSRTFQP